MNAGIIWWSQIGSSLNMLYDLSSHLQDSQSVVLHAGQGIPWKEAFYDAVEIRRTGYAGQRRLRSLQWEENADPGEMILNEFCSSVVRAEYWPGQTYAEYLGAKDDIVLCEYIVWVRDICLKADMTKWLQFVEDYTKSAAELNQSAIFVLEYNGDMPASKSVDVIEYGVEDYDCRVFALETAAALHNTEFRSYQAEMAYSISNGAPELCSKLLEAGEELLRDPVSTGMQLHQCSEKVLDEQKITSAVWEASVIHLFPVLERFRKDFIERYENELMRYLPITNSYGTVIRDPCDLEIGELSHIVNCAKGEFSLQAVKAVRLSRKIRNWLAHNRIVSYEDVKQVLGKESIFNLEKDAVLCACRS